MRCWSSKGRLIRSTTPICAAGVLTLIVDLDRPTQGIMVISQQAMLDLQAQMKAVMP